MCQRSMTAGRLTPQLASRMDEVYQRPRPQGPAPDVDGDTSTKDTVLLLSTGQGAVSIARDDDPGCSRTGT